MTTENVKQLLSDVSKFAGDGKIKVKVSAVRELAASDALNGSAALAAISILAFLADKTPMPIEERKHVEFVIDALTKADRADQAVIDEAIKSLTSIIGYYTEQVG